MYSLAVAALAFAAAGAVAAADDSALTSAVKQPWYVKHASDQIVNFCFFGDMFGGGYSTIGNGDGLPVGSFSTVAFSSEFTETLNVLTATTLTTTIPGAIVTIYGTPGAPDITSTAPATTLTSVVTPTPTLAEVDARPAHGLAHLIDEVEHYAHALAEAIVAPAEMTALLSSAAEDIMKHGYIHATKAEAYLTQASQAFEALKTDPAYSEQSAHLAAQPTRVDFSRAFSELKATHSAGFERFLAEPSGRSVVTDLRSLAKNFLGAFSH